MTRSEFIWIFRCSSWSTMKTKFTGNCQWYSKNIFWVYSSLITTLLRLKYTYFLLYLLSKWYRQRSFLYENYQIYVTNLLLNIFSILITTYYCSKEVVWNQVTHDFCFHNINFFKCCVPIIRLKLFFSF